MDAHQAESSISGDRGPGLRTFFIVEITLLVLTVAVRFWSRSMAKPEGGSPRFWLDDWLALAALPFAVTCLGLCVALVDLGLGRHEKAINPANLRPLMARLVSIYFLYDMTLVLLKASALCFLVRVFRTHLSPKWFTWAFFATQAINVAWGLGIMLATLLMCRPIAKSWNPLLPGHCGSTADLWLSNAIPSVIVDFIILVLPLPLIWRLHMNTTRKIATTAVFLLGYCAIIVSIGRLITVIKQEKQIEKDTTWGIVPVVYWICAELLITYFSICVPAMLVLGRRIGTNYLSPFASTLSSRVSEIGRSTGARLLRLSNNGSGTNLSRRSTVESDQSAFAVTRDGKSSTSANSLEFVLYPTAGVARAVAGSAFRHNDDGRIHVDQEYKVAPYGV